MMRFDALALQIFQKKEELFFYEFFVPKGPTALGPKYGLFGRYLKATQKTFKSRIQRFGHKNRK